MEEKQDKASIGMKILSFLIPLVGLILFISKKKERPGYAKGCGIAALIGFIVGVIMIPVVIVATIGLMGLAVVNTANEVVNSQEFKDSLSTLETAAYNAKFEAYEGNVYGTQVKGLLTTVKSNNAYQSDDSRIVVVTLDGNKIDPSVSASQIKTSDKYNVKMNYNSSGLVDKIIITSTSSSSTNTISNTVTNSIDSTNTVTNTTTNTVSNTTSSSNTVLDTNTIHNTIDNIANTLTNTIEYTNGILNQINH